MIITLCSSRKFFDRLWEIKKELELRGHEVLLPSMENFQDKIEEDSFIKIHNNLIRNHFGKINKSDAVLVANFDKMILKIILVEMFF